MNNIDEVWIRKSPRIVIHSDDDIVATIEKVEDSFKNESIEMRKPIVPSSQWNLPVFSLVVLCRENGHKNNYACYLTTKSRRLKSSHRFAFIVEKALLFIGKTATKGKNDDDSTS